MALPFAYRRAELDAARVLVREVLPATPQYAWPLLAADIGTRVWLKHENHTPIGAPAATELADGLACRQPDPLAVAALCAGLDHVVAVTDREIARAMRTLFEATHNVAEGAAAAAYAAAYRERAQLRGKQVAVVLTGGNVDGALFAEVLSAAPDRWLG